MESENRNRKAAHIVARLADRYLMNRHQQKLGRYALRIANRIVRPIDRCIAREASGHPSPVLIAGLPRSGTTLAYELLVQAFDVAFLTPIYGYAYGMPNLVTRAVKTRIDNPRAYYTSNYGRIPGRYAPAENAAFWNQWMPLDEDLGHFVPPQSITTRAAEDATATVGSMAAIAGRPYIFKNVYMTLSLPALFRLFRDIRVIVVQRQIEANIASIYKRRSQLSSWWSIRPPFANDVEDGTALEQTAFQCVRSQQVFDDSLAQLPGDNLIIVDYESICESPQAFIKSVAAWAGSEFKLRPGSELPGSFSPSKGPGLPERDAASLPALLDALHHTRSEYLARLHNTVAGN